MIDESKRRAAGAVAIVAFAAVLGTGPAFAQPVVASAPPLAPARVWAIVSLIGDEFSVVSRTSASRFPSPTPSSTASPPNRSSSWS